MKKGTTVFLLVFICFICIMTGVFIGRTTSSNYYMTTPSTETPRQATSGLLDINTATVADLTDLPGIGEVIAQRILDYRNQNGPFTSIDDLVLVEGVGEKRMDAIREFITVGG